MLWLGLWAENYEVRGVNENVSKAGKPYITIKVEDTEGNANEVSVTGENVEVVRGLKLRKGDIVDMRITVVTGRERNYTTLYHGEGSIIKQGNAYDGDVSATEEVDY